MTTYLPFFIVAVEISIALHHAHAAYVQLNEKAANVVSHNDGLSTGEAEIPPSDRDSGDGSNT
ncbi:hypothetical protein ACDY96_21270 [Rhizobium mongolense]|uniref:hypothetical protein n=1 Tax=Rhizobium mongolense TaxID=57676 RepID=UPI003555D11B